ncbi:MAG TPA: aminopeptidase [Burkholderiales bacterium]
MAAKRAVPLMVAASIALGGCANIGYYLQSVQGQLEVLHRERPIDEVMAAPETPEALRQKLAAVLKIRAFASEALGLPDNASYRRYADLDRPFAVYNVFATPELALKPLEWCFPFAGCVKYRGYFSRVEAERFAAELVSRGHDVFIGGVPAYSTLGWFADPVLNTFVSYPQPELARLIFHELAHQVVYVRDDTMFNESFAVTVQREGVRRWLASHGSDRDRELYQRVESRRRQFVEVVQTYRGKLEALYESDLPVAEKRARKAALFAELDNAYDALRAAWGIVGGHDRWLGQRPNNALLASVSIYTHLVPAFQALLRAKNGNLPAFYAEVKALAALPAPERSAQLAAIGAHAAARDDAPEAPVER